MEGAEWLLSYLHLNGLKILIKRIAYRFKRGFNTLAGGADRNLALTLQESGLLQEEIYKEIANKSGVEEAIVRDAFQKIGTESVKFDKKAYKKTGLPKEAVKTGLSPEVIRVMERNYDATKGMMTNLSRTRADAINRTFIEEIDKAVASMQTNQISENEAFYQACENIAENGIKYFTYAKDGKVRRESVEVAVMRALRTTMAQTSAQVVITRMKELGMDLIKVSAHVGARNKKVAGKPYADHSSWQGKIYSLSGNDKDYPPFYETTGYGTGEGLAGYNCRHSISPAIKGYTKEDVIDPEENDKQYAIEQKQRQMERAIRKQREKYTVWEQAYKEFPENEKIRERYISEQKRLQSQNKAYKEYCAENNLRPLEERLYIAHSGPRVTDMEDIYGNALDSATGARTGTKIKTKNTYVPDNRFGDYDYYSVNPKKEVVKAHVEEALKMQDSICVKESAWNGNVHVGNYPDPAEYKNETKDMWFSKDAFWMNFHEALHSRSVNGYTGVQIENCINLEEIACQLLTEEYCKKHKIWYNRAYEGLMTYIDEIVDILQPDKRYEFAVELFNVPLDKRASWIGNRIRKMRNDGIISDEEYRKANSSLRGVLAWII